MTDETGIRDMTGYKSIIPPFPETQMTHTWMKNDNQMTITNSSSTPITNDETEISDTSAYKTIIPRFLKLSRPMPGLPIKISRK